MDDIGWIFGLIGFAMACLCFGKINRLEQILRDNNIRPAASEKIAHNLQESVGLKVSLGIVDEDRIKGTVLECDGVWILIETEGFRGKKKKFVLRVDDVEEFKVISK